MSACSGISCAMAPATRTGRGGRCGLGPVPASRVARPFQAACLASLVRRRLRARCAARRCCVRGTADASALRATAARA